MFVFNPYDWNFHEDPYPIYRQLRDQHPCYYNPELDFYALSRHADVVDTLKDYTNFSNAEGVALESRGDVSKFYFILAMDPPRHNKVRGVIRKVFTPGRVADLEPVVRDLTRHYIEQFQDSGECEFIEALAGKMPMDLISEMVGVPSEDRDMVRNWANTLMERVDGSIEMPKAAIDAAINLLGYFGKMVAARRKRDDANDLTSALMAAEVDGERLSDDDVVSFLFLMSIAGNETTTKMLANALYWGWKNRSEFAKVQADRSRIADWVEETMRYDNSSQIIYRTTTCDIERHGVIIPAGKKVAMLLGAANRDERAFANPDVFDIDRDCGDTMAFGKGIHFCLGAALARMEGRACLDELFKTFRDYEVDESSLVRVHSGNVRGFSRFGVKFMR